MLDNQSNRDVVFEDETEFKSHPSNQEDNKNKSHIIRRNIEDYLAQRALEKRLKEVFDDDFLLD